MLDFMLFVIVSLASSFFCWVGGLIAYQLSLLALFCYSGSHFNKTFFFAVQKKSCLNRFTFIGTKK